MVPASDADTDAVLDVAESLVQRLESSDSPSLQPELLPLASFFLRLAAALLLEKDFPALPEALDILIARDQSRLAGRDLSRRLLEEQSCLMRRNALQLPPEPRRPGRPLTDHDQRLGAETAQTVRDLQAIRADLFCEYLFLGSHLPPPEQLPEPTAGALALLHKYWQDRRRLLLIREPRRKPEAESAAVATSLSIDTGGYTVGTKPELGAELKHVLDGLRPPKPLSRQAVETAAVVAMLQPVTAYEIQAARKVRNTDAIRTLLRRKLIAPAGRARGRGKALQYRTTPQFLVEFGLKDLSELPKVEAFQQVPGIKTDTDPDDH